MAHTEVKTLLVPEIVRFIGIEFGVDEETALDLFYTSATAACLADDELGLYGDSALRIFGYFCNEKNVTPSRVLDRLSQGE